MNCASDFFDRANFESTSQSKKCKRSEPLNTLPRKKIKRSHSMSRCKNKYKQLSGTCVFRMFYNDKSLLSSPFSSCEAAKIFLACLPKVCSEKIRLECKARISEVEKKINDSSTGLMYIGQLFDEPMFFTLHDLGEFIEMFNKSVAGINGFNYDNRNYIIYPIREEHTLANLLFFRDNETGVGDLLHSYKTDAIPHDQDYLSMVTLQTRKEDRGDILYEMGEFVGDYGDLYKKEYNKSIHDEKTNHFFSAGVSLNLYELYDTYFKTYIFAQMIYVIYLYTGYLVHLRQKYRQNCSNPNQETMCHIHRNADYK